MILLVTYQPEGHVEEQVAEMMPSESYEEIINTACEMWRHHLPPEDRILSRRLARQVQRANGSQQWIPMQPQRFADLVRNETGDVLELRLQIECTAFSSSPVVERPHGRRSPSTLELPSPESASIHGLNYGPHIMTSEPINLATGASHTVMPLTPESVFRGMPPSERSAASPVNPSAPPLASPQPDTTPPAFDHGVATFLAGKHTEARKHFQQAAYEFHERGNVQGEADCLRHLGMSCRHLKDYVAARSHLLTARAMYESLGPQCRQEQLRCTRHLARVEEDSGNDQLALLTYQELLRTTEREGLVTQHTWCSYYLGHLYNRMKLYKEALNILKDVVNTSREIRNGEIEGFATEESGYTAERQGHPQLAMSCYERALQLFKTHGEGKWIENENRVEKRMRQLTQGFPMLFKKSASRKWSIGAKMLNRD
ncbi:hypothetical protein FRC08_007058 [Ceratobasidium sp. 394]|nr:hypothetical protein FRC08_007058 [Ceratobasidium sp. 394]